MSSNRGSKRTAPSDDEDDQNDESTSAERNNSSRRSPTFQIKPGPASWKRSFFSQPNPNRSYLGSSSQKPGAVFSKTASAAAIDKKTAANTPVTTCQRLRNHSKESTIGIENDRNEFIWLVRKFRHLYDPKDPFFKNKEKKKRSWTAISEVVGMSAEDCRVKWKLLRDRYCREKKKKPQHIPPDFRDLMETELKFLDSVIQQRRTMEFSTSSPRRPSMEEEQTENASGPPASSVPRDDQDSGALSSKQARRDQQPRITMSMQNGKNAHAPSLTPRRSTNQSTPLNSSPKTKTNGNAGNNSASHDESTTEAENEGEEEEEEEKDEEKEEEDGDDNDNDGANGVQSKVNGRTGRRPIGTLNNAVSKLSRMKQTQDTNQIFADTLAVIFRQFAPKEKNAILSKFLKIIVKMQRKMKRP